jgi:hypothetical protein
LKLLDDPKGILKWGDQVILWDTDKARWTTLLSKDARAGSNIALIYYFFRKLAPLWVR